MVFALIDVYAKYKRVGFHFFNVNSSIGKARTQLCSLKMVIIRPFDSRVNFKCTDQSSSFMVFSVTLPIVSLNLLYFMRHVLGYTNAQQG